MRFLPLLLLAALLPASAANAGTAAPSKLNILLLTVDSFRPDRLGCYGSREAHTPNIDRLASRGALFTRAFSTAAWTNASLVSLLTGLYPGAHGVERRGESFPEGAVAPLELLSKSGCLVPEINYLFPMPNYRNLGFTPNAIRDLPQFLRSCRDSTFFAWYHFHGPHLPYSPPEKYRKMYLPRGEKESPNIRQVLENVILPRGEEVFSESEKAVIRKLYAAEVAAQDEEIGRVLEVLDSLGLDRRTVVILSADHGEELFDHGWLGHASTSLNGTLFDELIRIPLIIRLPDMPRRGIRVNELVQSVDLLPTLFELLGLPLDCPDQGHSFLGLLKGTGGVQAPRDRVFCETSVCGYQCPDTLEVTWLRAVRTESLKLVETLAPHEAPRFALYDLDKDPGEQLDVSALFPDTLARLQGILAQQVFRNQRQREALLASSGATRGGESFPPDMGQVAVQAPAEGETITYAAQGGKVLVSWSGPQNGEYLLEYTVGLGKYHLEGSFPVRGNSQTFGPFNPVFWMAFPHYNPWRFRVVPKGRPELASAWRTFTFN